MRLSLSSTAAGFLGLIVMLGDAAVSTAQERVTVSACVAREADYVRATAPQATDASAGPQLLLTHTQSGMPTYSLTGVREAELMPYVGQRVEISGTVERARTTPVLTTADGARTGSVNAEAPPAAGVTPDGAAAHEPSDALSATVKAGKVAEPVTSVSDLADRVAVLPRLNATTFTRVNGSCVMPRNVTTSAAAAAAKEPPAPTRSTPAREQAVGNQVQQVTVRGCLVRQTRTGTALSGQAEPNEPLVLTQAVMAPAADANRSAVPGSTPAGSGSGTLPTATGTTGAAPVDAATLTFALDVPTAAGDMRRHVGERVEIVGTMPEESSGQAAAGRTPPAPDTAHPSAPTKQVRVTSFRLLGGSCR